MLFHSKDTLGLRELQRFLDTFKSHGFVTMIKTVVCLAKVNDRSRIRAIMVDFIEWFKFNSDWIGELSQVLRCLFFE